MPASRFFFVRRRTTLRDLPDALVTGADTANALSARSSLNRDSVIADLAEEHRATGVGQAREAGDDRVVRVMGERGGGRRGERLDGLADGVEDTEQGEDLGAHRVLDQWLLAQL